MKVDYTKPIPKIEFPAIYSFETENVNEPMISLIDLGFEVLSVYYAKLIEGATFDAYARKTVAEKLVEAQKLLPPGYSLIILDAYRPITVQQTLWNEYRKMVAEENPEASDEEIDFKTGFFVSKPSYDVSMPSLHNTGGAIDLTIRDERGRICDMGTKFDDFRETANTAYFEDRDNTVVRENRRILYNVMTSVGFTNLPSEWWHFDYGTKFWGYFSGNKPLYRGILDYSPNRSDKKA